MEIGPFSPSLTVSESGFLDIHRKMGELSDNQNQLKAILKRRSRKVRDIYDYKYTTEYNNNYSRSSLRERKSDRSIQSQFDRLREWLSGYPQKDGRAM